MSILNYLKSLDVENKVLVICTKAKHHEISSLTKSNFSFEVDGFVVIKKEGYEAAIKLNEIASIELLPNPNIYSPEP